VLPRLGDLVPAELGAEAVRTMLEQIGARRSTPHANHCLVDLARIIHAAQSERRWPAFDPTAHVKRLPVQRQLRDTLTLAEARALIRGTEDLRLRTMVALVIFLALRKGEVLGLHLVDLDLDRFELHVRHSHARPVPKNGRWRSLPIPRELARHLRAWLSGGASGRTVVFPGRAVGGLLSRFHDLPNLVRAELVRLGLRSAEAATSFRFHDLRHTWTTLAESAGLPDTLRACVLGHAPSITERYTHRSMDRLRDQLELVFPPPARRRKR
jgi:integrase